MELVRASVGRCLHCRRTKGHWRSEVGEQKRLVDAAEAGAAVEHVDAEQLV
jgi:hypothetical protein